MQNRETRHSKKGGDRYEYSNGIGSDPDGQRSHSSLSEERTYMLCPGGMLESGEISHF